MEKYSSKELFQRTRLLLGDETAGSVAGAKVIIFGVGGVGSWCAEALIRSGVENLTIVDPDKVNVSNINRQLMATVPNIGRPKVEALGERLSEINPWAKITPVCEGYTDDTAGRYNLSDYDYVIDAIDTLHNKLRLIRDAAASSATFFSSMGAALKTDPTLIRVADFWQVRDCPLGAALRKQLRRSGNLPKRSFLCVYSGEVLENKGLAEHSEELRREASATGKAVINGTMSYITAIFGMTLAGLVVRHQIMTPPSTESTAPVI